MADEQRPPDLIASGLVGLVDGLRKDLREDIRDVRAAQAEDNRELRAELVNVERRVTTLVEAVDLQGKDTRAYIELFAKGHGEEHEAEAADRRQTHGVFYQFIRDAELDKARRDGALGVARYSIELISKHSARLVAVILAVAAAAGVATGNVGVSIGQ